MGGTVPIGSGAAEGGDPGVTGGAPGAPEPDRSVASASVDPWVAVLPIVVDLQARVMALEGRLEMLLKAIEGLTAQSQGER